MKDFSASYPGRKYRVVFYQDTDDFSVREMQGFECPPNNGDVRWVPEAGVSVSCAHFTADDAWRALRASISAERVEIRGRLDAIDAFLGDK